MADPFAASVDEDPAADFLAREQQELAGLEDDGFGGSVSDTSAAVESNQNTFPRPMEADSTNYSIPLPIQRLPI